MGHVDASRALFEELLQDTAALGKKTVKSIKRAYVSVLDAAADMYSLKTMYVSVACLV